MGTSAIPRRSVCGRQPAGARKPHPYWIARGLKFFSFGNGLFWTEKGFSGPAAISGGPKFKPVTDRMGVGMGFGSTVGSGTTDIVTGPIVKGATGFRSLVQHLLPLTAGAGPNLGRVFQTNTGSTALEEVLFINATTLSYARTFNGGSSIGQWIVSGNATMGAPLCFGMTHDQSVTATTPKLYTNGILGTTTTQGASSGTYDANNTAIQYGNRPSDNARSMDGWVGPTAIFDHPTLGLTDAEHFWLSMRPFAICEEPPQFILLSTGGNAYSLSAAAGSYGLTGVASVLKAGRVLPAASGSYALTGQTARLLTGKRLAAAAGSYSLTGQAAALVVTRKLVAAQGSYSLTGVGVTFSAGKVLTAAQGLYALTGQSAGLVVARKLGAAAGSYAITGMSAALTRQLRLQAGAGSYGLTGFAANLLRGLRLTAAQGVYGLTGQDATLTGPGARALSAGTGSYGLAGQAAGLRAARKMAAATGAYSLTGVAARLARGFVMPAASGDYAVTGRDAVLSRTRRLAAAAGGYALTGQDAVLAYAGADADQLYPLAGMSETFALAGESEVWPLAGLSETYPLAGL